MTLQQLKYIVAIDRYRSFAKAAYALGISQPTLSAMLVKLEDEKIIRQAMLNTITKTLLRFMPEGMMEERIVKYGIKL